MAFKLIELTDFSRSQIIFIFLIYIILQYFLNPY